MLRRILRSASRFRAGEYEELVERTLSDLAGRFEEYEDVVGSAVDGVYDCEYGSGVLTVKLGDRGTYVVNKQAPNEQIWLSSPVSGPRRFDWDGERWVDHRGGLTLEDRLQAEMREHFGVGLAA